jgi:hypothetical protein
MIYNKSIHGALVSTTNFADFVPEDRKQLAAGNGMTR